jgi:hypothetical protein
MKKVLLLLLAVVAISTVSFGQIGSSTTVLKVGGVKTLIDSTLTKATSISLGNLSGGGYATGRVLTVQADGSIKPEAATAISFGAVGAVPNANGGTITSGVINLQPASATFPGVMTAANFTTLTAAYINGGNTFAGNATIGLNDAFSLGIETNGVDRISIASGGAVTVSDLAGTGTRLVTASAAGLLSSTTAAGLMNEEFFTATAAQTAFTIATSAVAQSGSLYPLQVFRNGVKLRWVAAAPSVTEFTYSGTTVTLAACAVGDLIDVTYLK